MFHMGPFLDCAFDFSVFGQRNHVREGRGRGTTNRKQFHSVSPPPLSLSLLSADFFFAQTRVARVRVVGSLRNLKGGVKHVTATSSGKARLGTYMLRGRRDKRSDTKNISIAWQKWRFAVSLEKRLSSHEPWRPPLKSQGSID